MEQFRIRKDGFKEIRRAMLIKTIPIGLLGVFGWLAISYFNPNIQQGDVNIYPFIIPIMLGAFAFGLYRGVMRQKVIYDSYRLTVNTDDNIPDEKLNN